MGAIDLKSNVGFALLHASEQKTATASVQGTEVADFRGACFVIEVGTHTADGLSVTLQHRDGSDSYTDIPDTELDFDGNVSSNGFNIVSGLADTQIVVGYRGNKEDVGVVITDAGSGDAVVGAYVLKGYPRRIPAN